MNEFFFEYGLFAAKVITVIVTVLLAIVTFAILISSREKDRESIEIEKVNDKFEAMKEALEEEIFSKEELKLAKKERKKKEKEEAKAAKKRSKANKATSKKTFNKIIDKVLDKTEEETTRDRLFLLRFNGDIQASEVENMREAITAILTVAKETDEVVVLIDSPGGMVHNYGLAASQLNRIRQKKIKLTASVDLIAASGGYLMACVADKIIAAPFAVVGSIGVLAQIPNFHRLLEKHNIDIEQHTAGEYKTTLTLLGKNTDKARTKFREELEDTHQLFKQYVVEHRPQLDIEKLATGEHWYGQQAIALNLVDELMTSDDFLLAKSENMDIYEVTYVINETLTDKISTFFHGFTMKLLNNVWGKLTRTKW